MQKEAIILAGGLGTRLQNLVKDIPKPMADINGKPFLKYLLDYLSDYKIQRVILSVGYKYEVIENYFGKKYETDKVKADAKIAKYISAFKAVKPKLLKWQKENPEVPQETYEAFDEVISDWLSEYDGSTGTTYESKDYDDYAKILDEPKGIDILLNKKSYEKFVLGGDFDGYNAYGYVTMGGFELFDGILKFIVNLIKK